MHQLTGRNVHEIFQDACWLLNSAGIREETRTGPVLSLPGPVVVTYQRPMERVLLWPPRRANPFFHLFEALWMLAGKRDVAYLEQFNPRMREFSDDGSVFHGAYGYRWRNHFSIDQIDHVISLLKEEPHTRRAVLEMWDTEADLGNNSKDLPCNTHIYFRRVRERLAMTVCNRSNDIVWGMCGTNVVHFSILHELIAHASGNIMGPYYHFTNNLHIYDGVPKREIYSKPFIEQPYGMPSGRGGVECMPMFTAHWQEWLKDCQAFVEAEYPARLHYHDQWFQNVAVPMWIAWKEQNREPLKMCRAEDWQAAGRQYFVGKSQASVL